MTRISNALAASALIALAAASGCKKTSDQPSKPDLPATASALSVEEVRAITKEAYIYGFPMVDSYRVEHAYFVEKDNPEYKGGFNELHNSARVYTPDDKAVQTPNSDTPYSILGLDLRAEPMVLTVPAVDPKRYYSIQLVDAYTHNFAYIGSRATGSGAGNYLITGPGWKGGKPAGITQVIPAETNLVLGIYRTQLFGPDDLENVKKVQAGFKVQPLSAFLGKPAPPAAPAIEFIQPLTPQAQKTSLEFFNVLNFALQFAPTVRSEQDLMARFAKIGVGPGLPFDAGALSPEIRAAMEQGMADAWGEFDALKKRIDAKEVTSGDMLGTRDFLKNNYLYRMAAAVIGIYGNSKEEAMYPLYGVDADGQKLDGSKHYVLRFAPGALPPVNAFWSVTMYEMPSSLLVKNPLNRYLINSTMLPSLTKDSDGGLTLYIQNTSPGKDKEANWLPAPAGPFMMAMRLYWPKEEALDGKWEAPLLKVVPAD